MSARSSIVNALAGKLKLINGTGQYKTNLYSKNVSTRLKFWDEVSDFPYICIVAGSEYREYLPSNFKWGILNIALKLYVRGENPIEKLEDLIQDVELVISNNEELVYETGKETTEILITSILTDEGLLAPTGVGEVNVSVRYQI